MVNWKEVLSKRSLSFLSKELEEDFFDLQKSNLYLISRITIGLYLIILIIGIFRSKSDDKNVDIEIKNEVESQSNVENEDDSSGDWRLFYYIITGVAVLILGAGIIIYRKNINIWTFIFGVSFYVNFSLAFQEGLLENSGYKLLNSLREEGGDAKAGFVMGSLLILLVWGTRYVYK
jgi:hypothetical protein